LESNTAPSASGALPVAFVLFEPSFWESFFLYRTAGATAGLC
jgi:hypothetical protein